MHGVLERSLKGFITSFRRLVRWQQVEYYSRVADDRHYSVQSTQGGNNTQSKAKAKEKTYRNIENHQQVRVATGGSERWPPPRQRMSSCCIRFHFQLAGTTSCEAAP
jgi:hypothetical protein